ncbi:MAG: response regulator transcription factor [Hyphomicrobiales bacterium]
MRVLLAEDEAKIATDIETALKANGFAVEIAPDGETAWFRAGTEAYSAVILDIGLPALDGITVLKRLRSEGIATPILLLTARGSWSERVEGIDAGADDYLAKPFRMEELLARTRALVRRSAGQSAPSITVGVVSIDPRMAQVTVDGVPVQLTPLEYRLVHYLLLHKGRVISATELGDALYSHDHERDANSIEVLVGRVRRKLKVDVIETRRGFGYLVPAEQPA